MSPKQSIPVLLLLVIAAAFLWRGGASTSVTVQKDVRYKEQYWEEAIQKHGPTDAYKELKEKAAGLDPSAGHITAHMFGAALYKVSGLEALPICDTSYNYGCMHEFDARAIQDLGLTVLGKLNTACKTAKDISGCQHGIGHGLIAYLGYGKEDLTRAVSLCDEYVPSTGLQGCVSGVFMEYNLRSMLDTKPRDIADGELTTLCNSFAGNNGKTCTLFLSQWWWVVLPEKEPKERLVHMMRLCSELPRPYQQTCYEGVGLMVPEASAYNPDVAVTLCDTIAPDKQKALMCRAYAANVFSGTGTPQKASTMCKGLGNAYLVYCSAYARGDAGIDTELEPPQ